MGLWFKGIDTVLSTPASQIPLANAYFVDAKNGDDATGTGTPSNPWASINKAFASITNGVNNGIEDFDTGIESRSKKIILAEGYYKLTDQTVPRSWVELIANVTGQVFIDTAGANRPVNNKGVIYGDGLTLRGINSDFSSTALNERRTSFKETSIAFYQNNTTSGYFAIYGCVIRNPVPSSATVWHIENGIASPSPYPGGGQLVKKCTFINGSSIGSTLTGRTPNFLTIEDCDFETGTEVKVTNVSVNRILLRNCNWRGTVVNVDGGSTAITLENCIDEDPLYLGDPTGKGEYLISKDSPLIGAGVNGGTIGAFKVGEITDLSSPAENNNITVGATITITAPNNTGNIKPAWRTFDNPKICPILAFDGFPNATDDVPDSENLTGAPKSRTLEVSYRETIGGSVITKTFLYGLPMVLDNAGRGTGEPDFDPRDIASSWGLENFENWDNVTTANLVKVAEIQENYTLNNQ